MANMAIGFDLNDGKGIICCSCYNDILEKHETPELLVTVTRPSTMVDGAAKCPNCNLPYLRKQTLDAAETIKNKWF